jgi:hypothetical protein
LFVYWLLKDPLTSRSYRANTRFGCTFTSCPGRWKTYILEVQGQSCLSGTYYSGPSRRLTPTTAQLALTSTAEWRASNVKLGKNGPNVSCRHCYHPSTANPNDSTQSQFEDHTANGPRLSQGPHEPAHRNSLYQWLVKVRGAEAHVQAGAGAAVPGVFCTPLRTESMRGRVQGRRSPHPTMGPGVTPGKFLKLCLQNPAFWDIFEYSFNL